MNNTDSIVLLQFHPSDAKERYEMVEETVSFAELELESESELGQSVVEVVDLSDHSFSTYESEETFPQRKEQHTTSYSSSYAPLHGSEDDVCFSYRYDHFQYTNEDEETSSDKSRSDKSLCNTDNSGNPNSLLGQIDDKTFSHRPPRERRYSIGDSSLKIQNGSYSFRKTLFAAEVMVDTLRNETAIREHRDDGGKESIPESLIVEQREKGGLEQSKEGQAQSPPEDTEEEQHELQEMKKVAKECSEVEDQTTKIDEQTTETYHKGMEKEATEGEIKASGKDPIRDKDATEVEFIMTVSTSNRCSIMLDKDFRPSIEALADETDEETSTKCKSVNQNEEKNEDEGNRDSHSSLKFSISTPGKDPSNPIDVTYSDLTNDSVLKSNSEEELEAVLYRAVEAALDGEDHETYRETRMANAAARKDNEATNDEIEKKISRQLEMPHCDQDESESVIRAPLLQESNNDVNLKEINQLPQHDTLDIEPRIDSMQWWAADMNIDLVTSMKQATGDYHQYGEDAVPESQQKETELVEVQNVLIDLIRRKEYKFAIQRIRYFPFETFTPISKSVQNLALHETICGAVLGNGNTEVHSSDNEIELASTLSMLLIETNPVALETPGDGGYLPLHIACSSSFRQDDSRMRLSLIQKMLDFYTMGARHSENETGELPLHLAIRWICNSNHPFEKREDETIATLLLMAYPEGATLRDHSGMTPFDILKLYQAANDIDSDHSIFQSLERYFYFASQISKIGTPEPQEEKDDIFVLEYAEQSRLEHAERTNESCEDREGPPQDHIILSETYGKGVQANKKKKTEGLKPERTRDKVRKCKMRALEKLEKVSKQIESDFAERLLGEILDASDE